MPGLRDRPRDPARGFTVGTVIVPAGDSELSGSSRRFDIFRVADEEPLLTEPVFPLDAAALPDARPAN